MQETVFRSLPFGSAFFGFLFELGTHSVLLFFGFEHTVLADGFCFQARFFQNSCRFPFSQADFVLRIQSISKQSDERTDNECGDGYSNNRTDFECGKQ